MLSSVDSPRPKPTFCRTSSACNSSSVVIKEIRSSLFLATSIIEDEIPNENSSLVDDQCYKSTVHFECGCLKYSHVKKEWSVLHRPIRTREDNKQKAVESKSAVAMAIASLRPVSVRKQCIPQNKKRTRKNYRYTCNSKSSTETENRQRSRNRRKLSGDINTIVDSVDGHLASINTSNVDCTMGKSVITGSLLPSSTQIANLEDQPISPPIELVRCLLNGAEFISMMKCARWEVESSMRKMKNEVNANGSRMKRKNFEKRASCHSKARFWSRRVTKNLKQRSINLQPIIFALVASRIGTDLTSSKASPLSSLNTATANDYTFDKLSLETIMLKFIDECIRFAHLHTLDLMAPWSSCWQVRANLRSEAVESMTEGKNHPSFIADNESPACTTCRFFNELAQKGNETCDGNNKRSIEIVSFDVRTKIHEFVQTCLAKPREDILESNQNTVSSTKKSSKECNDVNCDRALSEAPKRNASRRSKVSTREPADSLVATGMKRKQSTLSSPTNLLSTYTKMNLLPESQRQMRAKYSRNISPSSVLENTATVILQRDGRASRTTRSDSSKRKLSESFSPELKTIEKHEARKEHDTHNIGCNNKGDLRLEKEKMSPNSLYQFFEKRRNRSKIPEKTFGMDDNDKQIGDSIIYVSRPKQHESKDLNRIPSLGTSSQPNGVTKNSLMRCESRKGEDSLLLVGKGTKNQANRSENERQQNTRLDSLHSLSKSSPPVPSSDSYVDATSIDDKSLDERFICFSPAKTAVRSYHVDGQAQQEISKEPEREVNTCSNTSFVQHIRVEEHLEAAKDAFDKRLLMVKEDRVDDVTLREKIASHGVEHHEKDHGNEESPTEPQDYWSNPDQACTDNSLKEDPFHRKNNFKTLEAPPSLPWVNLSHIGHISDYHGYKRKYEHFAPLQFGPVADIRGQIERTLRENEDVTAEESDEEVFKDNRDYEKAIHQYEKLAEKERSLKKKYRSIDPPKPKIEPSDDMVVVFSTPEIDDEITSPMASSAAMKWTEKTSVIDELSCSEPPIKFQIFDDEDDVLMSFDEDEGGTKRRRKSRSAQIAHQKKTSIRMLHEMLHTLHFIEKYNRRSKSVIQETVTDANREDVKAGCSDEYSSSRKNNSGTRQCRSRKVRSGRCKSSTNAYRDITAKPPFATLNASTLLQSYGTLRKSLSLSRPLNGKDDIEAVKDEIQNIIGKANVLNEFFRNNEISSEEKTLARCIRGYSSKADQEKIEKRDFEERQKLRQHEFEYYCRLRKKKKSPEEIEWNEISSRPIYYARDESSLPTTTHVCNFKPNCKICGPILDLKCRDNTIFSPRFRRAESNMFVLPSGTVPDDDSALNDISNSLSPTEGEQLASLLKLSELYHTLDFINKYNDGMIVSTKRRK